MLEVRYLKDTGELTGWCGDVEQFGKLDRGRDTEDVVTLTEDVPAGPLAAFKYDGDKLATNPDYVPPEPARNLAAEINGLDDRLKKLEKK